MSTKNKLELVGGGVRVIPNSALELDESAALLSLGTQVLFWFGDDPKLGTLTGQIPKGYISKPLYKQWNKNTDKPGTFSFGPYQRLDGTGDFKVWFFIEVTNRGSADEEVLYADIYDYDARKVLLSKTFKVKEFPAKTEGFTIYSPEISIPPNRNRVESRIMARGGADLKLWGIRWEVSAL